MASTDTVAPTITLSLHDLTTHLLEHHLPAPTDIWPQLKERLIQVAIREEHRDAWEVSGFHFDDEHAVPRPIAPGWEQVYVDGRLPVTGTRLRLSYFRREQRPVLRAVAP